MEILKRGCLISLVTLCLFAMAKVNYSQTISPDLFGQNAWMPDTIGSAVYGGKLHKNWEKVKNSGAVLIRYGGISVDKIKSTNYQFLRVIDSIRTNGMEPIIQVPFNNYQYSAQEAANIVQYINITKGKNIKYWSIGNEPDLKYGVTSASQVAAYFKSFASAMKAVDPSIKILGPDCAWFNQSILDGLTSPGSTYDITGKDGAGRYYLDYITFHTYPFNGSQTRAQVISKLTEPGSYRDDLAHLKSRVNSCNAYHNRTGSSALKMGVTEANISYQNSTSDGLYGVGTNSFIGGQFIAEMLCLGMKQELDVFNMWSVIEGSSGGSTNIGYIDPSTGNKKPSYYHFKLVADNFKGNYANGTDNITNVKSFGSKNSQEICVLIMNQDQTVNYNYTVRLNTGTVSGNNALKINIDASVAQEYSGVIQNQSTVLLTFNLAGTLVKKCEYSLSGHASANLPPNCIEIVPQISDITPPAVTTYSPADNAVNVSKSANLILTFNEPIQKGSGNIIVKEGGVVKQTIDVTGTNVTISGNTATINPSDFSYSAAVNIEMASGVFKDTADNNYAGIADAATWNFSVGAAPDTTSPVVASYNPADNATNVSSAENLILTFNEPIQKGIGNIIVKEGGVVKQTIDVTGTNVIISGNTATINPSDFSYSAAVNIEMASGVFKDTADNNYAGIANATTWNFSVGAAPDTTSPIVTTYSPADNATNVSSTANLILTFNEPIQKGIGNIIVKEGGVVKQTIDVTGTNVIISGNTATINPSDFTYSAAVNIEMASGVFKDTADNNYAGIADAATWNFSVEAAQDTTPPVVASYNPADNATNVSSAENLILTFNEPIQKGIGNIIVKEGGVVKQTIDVTGTNVTVSGNTATINPADFANNSAVNIEMAAGVFKDTADNSYAGIASATAWNFSVETAPDKTSPVVTSYNPADNATNVSSTANLILTFNEPIQKGIGNIIVKEGGVVKQTIDVTGPGVTVSGNTATINPADFTYSAAVNIEMASGVFKDTADNNYAGIADAATWNFSVEAVQDTTPPTVITYVPADNAVNVIRKTKLVLKFSETVQKGTGDITIRENGIIKQTIVVSGPDVKVNGNTVTINPADFTGNTMVNIEMPAGVFKDMTNNSYAGISDTLTWNFQTKKSPAVSYIPARNGNGISSSANLILAFDEEVKLGTGEIIIRENGVIKQTIDVTGSEVTISEGTITIDPEDFEKNASVSLEISEGAFTDLSGENLDINNDGPWNFEIESGSESEMGIEEGSGDFSLNVFPNPCKGKLTVGINKPASAEKIIELVSISGQVVYRSTSSFSNGKEEIELDQSVSNGIYLVRVKDGDRIAAFKIVLDR